MSYESVMTLINFIHEEIYFNSGFNKVALNDIKSIWYYLGINITLNKEELKNIKDNIKSLNETLSKVNNSINEFYSEMVLDNEAEHWINLFKNFHAQIKDKKSEILFLIQKIKIEKYKTQKLSFYKRNEKNWFETLIYIYLKEDGNLPTLPLNIFRYFKEKWKDISLEDDRQFIIYVCEDILGGISLENIASNFYTWIKRNITDAKILKDFYII